MSVVSWARWAAVPVVLVSVLGAVRGIPGPSRYTFDETTDGWAAVPPPTGVPIDLGITHDAAVGFHGRGALRASYRSQTGKLPALVHPANDIGGTGVRVRLWTARATTIVLGLAERGGANYMYTVGTQAGRWQQVEAPFAAFYLSPDSKDANGRLDLDQVGTLIIADAAGFMPGAGADQTLLIDLYEVADDVHVPAPKPYRPLLDAGVPSPSGARATVGVTYLPGRFGQAILTAAPGALAVVPIQSRRSWRWEQGTIEMRVSPRFDMAQVADFSALLAMQDEPFITGLRGSLLVFYTRGRQIAMMFDGKSGDLVSTPPLAWARGSWHHLALSWGPRGMRAYVDGRPGGENPITCGPAMPTGDVVVGNHAWTLMSGHPANTAIDDLRLSSRQRDDAEIAADASALAPAMADADTVALEHFDGAPMPPIALAPSTDPWHATRAGQPVALAASVPGSSPAQSELAYAIRTPGGAVVRTGRVPITRRATRLSGSQLVPFHLGAFDVPGFYRIEFRQRRGARVLNEGHTWFRVMPHATVPRPSKLFGASACYADTEDSEAFFRLAEAAGVGSLRLPFEWSEIEPSEGRFVWEKYDRIVRWADRHHVELVPTFIWEKPQPAWAGRGSVGEGLNGERYPPEDMARWSEFVSRVVERYKRSIHWWIPANEPNLARYWHPKPDAGQYAALLKATASAVHRADPTAKVLGFSVSQVDLRFLETGCASGALDHCDAVGVHPYICPNSPDSVIALDLMDSMSAQGTFRESLLAAAGVIAKHGGKQKLWLDEAGQTYRDDFIAPNWGVAESVAAQYLAKVYVEALASGAVERVLWFSFHGGEYGSFALVRPDGSPTLPLAAYVAACERIGSARLAKVADRADGVKVREFLRSGTRVRVAWRATGTSEIELRPGERAFDLYGFPLAAPNARGKLKVGCDPLYIESDGARAR